MNGIEITVRHSLKPGGFVDLKKCEDLVLKRPIWINADQVTFVEPQGADGLNVHLAGGGQRTITAKGNPFTDQSGEWGVSGFSV